MKAPTYNKQLASSEGTYRMMGLSFPRTNDVNHPASESPHFPNPTNTNTAYPHFLDTSVTTTLAPPANHPQHSMLSPQQSDHLVKRGRGDHSNESTAESYYATPIPMEDTNVSHTQVPPGSSFKKTRSNNYTSPTEMPKTLISTMGTLVPSPFSGVVSPLNSMSSSGTRNDDTGPRQVQLRRELSVGKLEAFLGERENDSMDAELSRPRSMSF